MQASSEAEGTSMSSWCEIVRILKHNPPGSAEPFAFEENKYISFYI